MINFLSKEVVIGVQVITTEKRGMVHEEKKFDGCIGIGVDFINGSVCSGQAGSGRRR
jgi:hypothetical protein